jgi:hypothetical protein
MSMYKILLLTDQQLNRGSSPADNMETIDREYAALTEEDKTKYNALVKGMFRDKYSNASNDRIVAAEATAVDITQISNEDPNVQTSIVKFYESLSLPTLLITAILSVFGLGQ